MTKTPPWGDPAQGRPSDERQSTGSLTAVD